MQIYRVTGHVTLSRSHPSFTGSRLLATESCGAELCGRPPIGEADLLVVWDDLGAGIGSLIAVSDGAEAAQPFKPGIKPVDAYCAAILDSINLELSKS